MAMQCNWQRQSRRSWKIRPSHRTWAGAENSAWRTNFVSARLPNHSVKYCAIYANPERDTVVRAVLRIWRTPGESGSAFKWIGKAGPPGDGTYGRLGLPKASGEGWRRSWQAWRLRMGGRRQRSEQRISAELASLPRGKLESGSHRLLQRESGSLCNRAYFRVVRSARTNGGGCMPETRNTICRRADRNVCADRTKHFLEAHVPHRAGGKNDQRRCGHDRHRRAGSAGAGGRRDPARQDCLAPKWRGRS